MSSVVSDRVLIGPGPDCNMCGYPSERYRHGDAYCPPANKGYYRAWNICANAACKKTVFADQGDYVPPMNQAPVQVSDSTVNAFIDAVHRFGVVSEGTLRAIFTKSKTFKTHWLKPEPKSTGSMMFTCFHFGLTHDEALIVLIAWHDVHGTACADDLDDLDALVGEKYEQARAQAAAKDEPQPKAKPRLTADVMAVLDTVLDVEKIEFDPTRQKYVVVGVVR